MSRLEIAAQYAYDQYLSKPYTNKNYLWDWEYNGIPRPNHGLAHSLRGAMYAPIVIQYYSQFAKDKDEFQFSPDDIEKIQIVLMFRVAGRESDSGFHDDKIAYARYQEQHANAFKAYCAANPGVFTAEEVDKYAEKLRTYAHPDSKDPLSLIIKTCHNLDLLRCVEPKRYEKELEPARAQLGDNLSDLINYAKDCILATGMRIFENQSLRIDGKSYNSNLFLKSSTSVTECMRMIDAVPRPVRNVVQSSLHQVASQPFAPVVAPLVQNRVEKQRAAPRQSFLGRIKVWFWNSWLGNQISRLWGRGDESSQVEGKSNSHGSSESSFRENGNPNGNTLENSKSFLVSLNKNKESQEGLKKKEEQTQNPNPKPPLI